MKFLEESSPLGANHPAVKQYNKCMRGADVYKRQLIDHIIVGGDNREFFSFREKGMIDNPKICLLYTS